MADMVGGGATPARPDIDVPLAVAVSLMHLNVGEHACHGPHGSQFSFEDEFKFHFVPKVIYTYFAVL